MVSLIIYTELYKKTLYAEIINNCYKIIIDKIKETYKNLSIVDYSSFLNLEKKNYEYIFLLHPKGFYNLIPSIRNNFKNKFNNSKIISFLKLQKYDTIENKTYYLLYSNSLKKTSEFLYSNLFNPIKLHIQNTFNIYVDDLNYDNELIKELKKQKNISFVNNIKDSGICIFTKIVNKLSIQYLRIEGIKIFSTIDQSKNDILFNHVFNIKYIDNKSSLIDFNKHINECKGIQIIKKKNEILI